MFHSQLPQNVVVFSHDGADALKKSKHTRGALLGMLLGAALLACTGCGPIQSISSIMRADSAINAANAVEGWKYACYEFYAAKRFLYRARVEAGFSDYEAATQYADKAEKYAKRARVLARLHRTRNSRPLVGKAGIPFVLEGRGQVRVICNKPPTMKKKYKPKTKKQ